MTKSTSNVQSEQTAAVYLYLLTYHVATVLYVMSTCIVSCQLLDIVYQEETLLNVIRSVTKNGRSILLTAVLAFILIYLFSIVGFIFFKDDFMIEVDALDSVGINKGSCPPCGAGAPLFPPCPFNSSSFALFTFLFLSLALLIFFFFCPSLHFYQNSPTPFPGWKS